VSRFLSLALVAVVASATLAQSPAIPPDLENYVKKPEPDYKWTFQKKDESDAGAVYLYRLVSQKWHDELWEHDLQVFVPKEATDKSSMVILNTGGAAGGGTTALGLEIARRVKYPVAVLFQIPKQPLYGGKKEDALIAETFVRFLETKDSSWPLLFPMAKSVVKAMDALQEIGKKEWNVEVKHFVITGASKRGWTSWLTAATGDKRVKAIAPLVIDTLNFQKQMPHQFKSFGKYSEQIHDYEERKLLPLPDTDDARRLWAMVDPWVYRDRLTLPKLLVHGTNDPYWAQDALNQYWDDLKGDKWVLYVPNAGHDLRPQDQPNQPGAKKDVFPLKAIDTLGAYSRLILSDKKLPKVEWKDAGVKNNYATAQTHLGTAPASVQTWTTTSATRDFRKAVWVKNAPEPQTLIARPPGAGDGEPPVVVLNLPVPASGYAAGFVEFTFDLDGSKFNLSTPITIAEAKK
jgi:PhoPQ-activated pathogenicity-related protein